MKLTEENKIIGNNIYHLRKEKGLTQQQLAAHIGVNKCMIGSYEEHRALPSICNFYKMSLLFKVSMEEMMKTKNDE